MFFGFFEHFGYVVTFVLTLLAFSFLLVYSCV